MKTTQTTLTITTILCAIFGILFLLSGCKKEGCTEPNAINYDSKADKNDGSCIYNNSGGGNNTVNSCTHFITFDNYDGNNYVIHSPYISGYEILPAWGQITLSVTSPDCVPFTISETTGPDEYFQMGFYNYCVCQEGDVVVQADYY